MQKSDMKVNEVSISSQGYFFTEADPKYKPI